MKKGHDVLDLISKSLTWAPQMILDTDQGPDLSRHPIFAQTGRGLNSICWRSKFLYGLDQNLCKFLKNHENDKKRTLQSRKNSEKITKILRRLGRSWLEGSLMMLWWSQVGHSWSEPIAGTGWMPISWNRSSICLFSSREKDFSLIDSLNEF